MHYCLCTVYVVCGDIALPGKLVAVMPGLIELPEQMTKLRAKLYREVLERNWKLEKPVRVDVKSHRGG